MLFGLALLAGLVGYAVVDPFGNEGDDSGEAGIDGDLETEAGAGTGIDDLLGDDTETDADAANPDTANPDTAETDPTDTDDTPVETSDAADATDSDTATDTTDTTEVIDGTTDDDLIYGGDGDYTMNGGGGDDQLHGGDGSNTLNGDEGDDTLFAGDGFVDQSENTLNGGAGNDTLYGSNEAENLLNGGEGNDEIHMRGQDTATGGDGADSFHYSTEYSDGEISTISDYDAVEDQIIVEHTAGFVSGGALAQPQVSINIDGDNAIICLDGEECVVVQNAANSLTVGDILLRATPAL